MGFALSGLGILVMYFLMCVYVTAFDVASEGTCYLSQIPASLFRRLSPVITVCYIQHKCTVLPKLVTVCPYIAIYILLVHSRLILSFTHLSGEAVRVHRRVRARRQRNCDVRQSRRWHLHQSR